MSAFPVTRLRRFRRTASLRGLVRETRLSLDQFVMPLFVAPEPLANEELPGMARFDLDGLLHEVEGLSASGVRAVLLFGVPAEKDEEATGAWEDDGIVQQALRALRPRFPELVLLTDVCLCEYTSHGHCGVVVDGDVDNDRSLELLARTAVSHAEAGADIVAPSDMMDGRVGAIREALDDRGFERTPILAYSAKYASAFYGPFREAADSAPAFGDRRGYQMDPANVREAMRECKIDLAEGADAIMIKPALPYLDVIRAAREAFQVPLAAYNVSGEYAMVKAAARAGWLDERAAALESLTAIKRAGADLIVSYWTQRPRRRGSDRALGSLPPRARADPRRRELAGPRDARGRPRRAAVREERRGRRTSRPRTAAGSSTGSCPGGRSCSATPIPTRSRPFARPRFAARASAPRPRRRSSSPRRSSTRFRRWRRCGSSPPGPRPAMSALRLARAFTKRDRILKTAGGYHGHADALLASAGLGARDARHPRVPRRPDRSAPRTRSSSRTTISTPRPRR